MLTAPSSNSSIPKIACHTTARQYVKTLTKGGNITVQCTSSCALNVGETQPGWAVYVPKPLEGQTRAITSCDRGRYGYGPWRSDSSICKAAFIAGVTSDSGGVATLYFADRARLAYFLVQSSCPHLARTPTIKQMASQVVGMYPLRSSVRPTLVRKQTSCHMRPS